MLIFLYPHLLILDIEHVSVFVRFQVDGMQIPKLFIQAAERLLKPGSFFIIEHHERQGELIRKSLANEFLSAQIHTDLTGRDRFTSALRR